jgi:hypothetical protein
MILKENDCHARRFQDMAASPHQANDQSEFLQCTISEQIRRSIPFTGADKPNSA